MKRRTLLAGAAAAMAGVTAGKLVCVEASAQGKQRVTLQLGWFYAGDQIGEVCAKHAGYYDAEGLDVRLQPGGPNVDGIAVVASGRFELGQLPSSPSLMLAVSQGIPVRCFAVGLQQHPFTFFSLMKNAVREPKDLIGKRIGVQPTAVVLVRALLARHNIPEKDVQIVAAGRDMSPLLTGHIDVLTGWQTNITTLRVLGNQWVGMRLWDAGVRLYANLYYATVQTLKAKSEVLAKFVRATAKGWELARSNPDRAVDFVVKEFPNRDRKDERDVADVILRYAFSPNTRRNGWGAMDRAMWQEQIDLYAGLKQFARRVPKVDEVMTLEVLKATEGDRPRIG